jgi:hypothetical protein
MGPATAMAISSRAVRGGSTMSAAPPRKCRSNRGDADVEAARHQGVPHLVGEHRAERQEDQEHAPHPAGGERHEAEEQEERQPQPDGDAGEPSQGKAVGHAVNVTTRNRARQSLWWPMWQTGHD